MLIFKLSEMILVCLSCGRIVSLNNPHLNEHPQFLHFNKTQSSNLVGFCNDQIAGFKSTNGQCKETKSKPLLWEAWFTVKRKLNSMEVPEQGLLAVVKGGERMRQNGQILPHPVTIHPETTFAQDSTLHKFLGAGNDFSVAGAERTNPELSINRIN